ncbi:NAD(P)-binding domain-containing protein [Sinomicrobium kalidii]|uniref:NAD(P)-dependent oxidoreductase n=1 Tax=Sinomicrobium kalidii TaxID=2900738 RepID=UPI001E549E15|nr:NAD(P)-binding domain-containing protein [Sinomicrobium kalidii]UGU15539.1 NAD(P)-binding domain-containing protein [Sinomicrobium kalidii]
MKENNKIKQHVTVLGLGAMGTALAGAFLQAGHRTTVWNRSADKMKPLLEKGAVAASTVAEAIAASDLIVVCVLNYTVLEKIVKPVAGALRGRTLVSLTNDTPQKAKQMAAWTETHGINYLDGSVLVPVPVVGQSDALLLYSGAKGVFDRHLNVLKALGGKSIYLGDEPGRAALYDLGMTNIFFISLTGVLYSYALLNAEGEKATDFLPYAREIFAVAASFLEDFADSADNRHYPGDLDNIAMEAAGIEHIIRAGSDAGINVSVPEAVKSVFDRAIAAGFGANGMPGIIEGIK